MIASLTRLFSHKTLAALQRLMFPAELIIRQVETSAPVPYNPEKNCPDTELKNPSVIIDPSTNSK
jgi:hypothetical protein